MNMKITIRPFKTRNADARARYTHVLQFPELPGLIKEHAHGEVKQAEMGECTQPTVGIKLKGNPPEQFNWTNGEVHIEPDSGHGTLNCRLTFHGLKESLKTAGIGIRITRIPLSMRLKIHPFTGQKCRLFAVGGTPKAVAKRA